MKILFYKDRLQKDKKYDSSQNRGFTYLLMANNKFIYASSLRITALKFISTMSASKDVLALASAEFDISGIEEGKTHYCKMAR
ncbi:MAG: hypothetical protein Ct9H90mP28_4540 [Paracoccaceae bacterium]|nr:MAG: hypothetical protein Ct9H90mP28_4540 [Paracoccaceae bacterium]